MGSDTMGLEAVSSVIRHKLSGGSSRVTINEGLKQTSNTLNSQLRC